MPAQIAARDALHALFNPRAVATIGASGGATKHGCVVPTNLRDTGLPGGIHGIGRRLKEARAVSWPDRAGSIPRP